MRQILYKERLQGMSCNLGFHIGRSLVCKGKKEKRMSSFGSWDKKKKGKKEN